MGLLGFVCSVTLLGCMAVNIWLTAFGLSHVVSAWWYMLPACMSGAVILAYIATPLDRAWPRLLAGYTMAYAGWLLLLR